MEKKSFKKKLTLSVSSLTKKESDKIRYAKSQNENAVIIEKKNIRAGFMKVNQKFSRDQIKSGTKTDKTFNKDFNLVKNTPIEIYARKILGYEINIEDMAPDERLKPSFMSQIWMKKSNPSIEKGISSSLLNIIGIPLIHAQIRMQSIAIVNRRKPLHNGGKTSNPNLTATGFPPQSAWISDMAIAALKVIFIRS